MRLRMKRANSTEDGLSYIAQRKTINKVAYIGDVNVVVEKSKRCGVLRYGTDIAVPVVV